MAAPVLYRFSAAVVAVCFVAALSGVCKAQADTQPDTESKSQEIPQLLYFDTKGRAEAIRLTFYIGGVPFEDMRVRSSDFPSMKPVLPSGQLPVLVIGQRVYDWTTSILTYAGHRAGLIPSDPEEALKVDQLQRFLDELMEKCLTVLNETDQKRREEMGLTLANQTLPRYFKRVGNMFDADSFRYTVGKMLTIADVSLYCVLTLLLERGDEIGVTASLLSTFVPAKVTTVYHYVSGQRRILEWEGKHLRKN